MNGNTWKWMAGTIITLLFGVIVLLVNQTLAQTELIRTMDATYVSHVEQDAYDRVWEAKLDGISIQIEAIHDDFQGLKEK